MAVKAPLSSRYWFPGSRYVPELDLFVRRVAGATEKNPPEGPYVLTGPATDVEANKLRHSAAAFRRMLDASLGFRQGVVYTRGSCQDLKCTATGTDVNLSVNAGAAFIRGTQATDQGMYHGYNDATKVIPWLTNNPAHATLDRIDLCVARINDTAYSGALDTFSIEAVTGTPAGSPVAPAAPANSLILAQILVIHASTVVVPGNITDRRVPAGNGEIVLDDILIGTDSRYPAAAASVTFLNTAGGIANLIPPGLSDLEVWWFARGDAAAVNVQLLCRLNNISTATYDFQLTQASAATTTSSESLAQTSMLIGHIPAASATANYYGQGEAKIRNYSGAVGNKLATSHAGWMQADTTGTGFNETIMAKARAVAVPITRLDVLLSAGNFAVGSRLVLKGKVGLQP